ncbi:glycosyl hydrolase [Paracoccidioides lutzii Pb01]|uniref:Glycosyl hydrolase n=1 Tax=Paracoccidioides lutzii (strain ATCC MYA-826 / Pb01) TaxID=502779 RepID=C1H4M4_PARBA|nr:glycosyl hydrolase [Paracoccidioides lutzii Pb01]EEH34668.2 glycosyl hydrolase [Paracoccidioides lutzii Pb01]
MRGLVFACTLLLSYALALPNYGSYAEAGLQALQKWYNTSTGLWETTGWWNSANCLTTVGNLMPLNDYAASIGKNIFSATFKQAQKAQARLHKKVPSNGLVEIGSLNSPFFIASSLWRSFPGFINDYYDDEGWWALGWINAYDVTKDQKYLQMARDIFEDMTGGWDSERCGGGIWWDKRQTALVAISNELFLSVAAHLATRVPDKAKYYSDWAIKEWKWFKQSGFINGQNNINDGIELIICKNNGGIVWSYNQGVILGALVELSKVFPGESNSFLDHAHAIATAAIRTLSDEHGILHDRCEPDCGGDGPQFKGIFMRNLQVLHKTALKSEYKFFIEKNADSIWANDQNDENQFGINWAGPFAPPALASTQSSALDALVAAAAIQS